MTYPRCYAIRASRIVTSATSGGAVHEACPPRGSAGIVANMTASTVAQYLAALPADRRAALSAVRKAVNENLPNGYEERHAVRDDRLVRPAVRVSGGLWRESQSVAAICCARIAEVGHGAAFPVLLRSSHSLNLVHQRIQEERQETRHG